MEANKKLNISSDVGAFEEADDDTLREINLLREKLIYSEDELMKLNKNENIEEKNENEENDEEKGGAETGMGSRNGFLGFGVEGHVWEIGKDGKVGNIWRIL